MTDRRNELFLSLTPERVLDAVEAAGLEPTGLCYPLNSFENRVYEIELRDGSRVVAKFYRPGRWSRDQILEEHTFLAELHEAEVAVCGLRPFQDGGTLRETGGIHYCLSPRRGGRAPDELDDRAARRLGMLIGRMHAVGASQSFAHRPTLDAERYVLRPLRWLDRHDVVPGPYWRRYRTAAESIAECYEEAAQGLAVQRIHADLHLGNVLMRDGVLHLLDFDDMATGPAVQDLWLALPGRDAETRRQRALLLEGYEQFRILDPVSWRLVEPLRGLRLVRYAGWLARRWHDPAFRAGWPQFGTDDYWREQTADLEEQLRIIRQDDGRSPVVGTAGYTTAGAPDGDPSELTNADYFWDWED